MDPAILAGWIPRIVLVISLAAIGTAILRRPRLFSTASLRGGTSTGVLYVVVNNRGRSTAHGLKIEVRWEAENGAVALARSETLGTLPGNDARSLRLKDLVAQGSPTQRWSALRVRVTARNALPTSARIEIQPRRPSQAETPAAVEYRDVERCPVATDGAHVIDVKPLFHDGVTERWQVCRLCGHLKRLPLTADEEATRSRVRAERIERERRRMEEEFRRAEAEARARPRATGSRAREDARARAPPPIETDPFPVNDAYQILGLDPSATWSDVTTTHRKLAKRFHPDRAPAADERTRADLHERMQDINRARDRLREHFAVNGFK